MFQLWTKKLKIINSVDEMIVNFFKQLYVVDFKAYFFLKLHTYPKRLKKELPKAMDDDRLLDVSLFVWWSPSVVCIRYIFLFPDQNVRIKTLWVLNFNLKGRIIEGLYIFKVSLMHNIHLNNTYSQMSLWSFCMHEKTHYIPATISNCVHCLCTHGSHYIDWKFSNVSLRGFF